jgi:hypothetical protein
VHSLERFVEGETGDDVRKSNTRTVGLIRRFCEYHRCYSASICSFLMDEAGLSRWASDTEHPIGREWAEPFGVVDVIDLTKVGQIDRMVIEDE